MRGLLVAVHGAALVLALAACASAAPTPSPTPTISPPTGLGAGFRYSTYGPGRDPGPEYWARVGAEMAERFDGAAPEAIWIVSEVSGPGTVLTFPGTSDDVTIHFSSEDNNEAALDLFDELGVRAWLQVEPGDAPIPELVEIVMDRYGAHPSVIGFGIDVEWLNSSGEPEGRPVTDAEAEAWVAAIRNHDPNDRLFLKHWETEKMPPTARDGIVFIDDSQGHGSLDAMASEFGGWADTFAPAAVGYQYGYTGDQEWWRELPDPPADIGRAILAEAPNTAGLYWVDFTVLEVFPP